MSSEVTVSGTVDILLVEDDQRLAELTAGYLSKNGFAVRTEGRGDRAIAAFAASAPRLVILDLMLPGMDGLAVCRELRETFAGPILMLTAKNTDMDQVVGLSSGADDYVTKPADPMVLLARIQALLRRAEVHTPERPTEQLACGALRLSRTSRRVWIGEREIPLSTKEFSLLAMFMEQPGAIMSREDLYERTRGIEYDGVDRSIDVLVSRLRRKLGDRSTQPEKIKTVWGLGYLLVPDAWRESR